MINEGYKNVPRHFLMTGHSNKSFFNALVPQISVKFRETCKFPDVFFL